ncbi:hypothetical protein BGZ50_005959 [Haplosporangium sp. Z 11]|nr:hypothetical protein BGZ50_005959 [Haplosporangium sp. Z 11]
MTRRRAFPYAQSQSPSPFSFGHTQTTAGVTPAAVTTTNGNHSAFTAGTGFNTAGTGPNRAAVFSTTTARGSPDITEAPVASLFAPIPANIFTGFPPPQTTGPTTATAATSTTAGAGANIYNSRDILKRTASIMEYNKSIQFRLKWYASILTKEKSVSQAFRTSNDEYDFDCRVTTFDDHLQFDIVLPNEEQRKKLEWVTTATIQSLDRAFRTVTLTTPFPKELTLSISSPILATSISPDRLGLGMYVIDVSLTSDDIPRANYQGPGPMTHSDFVLGKMLDDTSSHDVFFEFETPWFELHNSDGKNDGDDFIDGGENEAEDMDEDELEVVKKADECAEEDEEQKENGDIKDAERRSKKGKVSFVKSTGDHGNTGAASTNIMRKKRVFPKVPTIMATVSAHKVVLSQFDYFKTMFSSSFAEGGPGTKRITIKDTDVYCFRLLIEFLYLGQLRPSTTPKELSEEQATDHRPTWEDVYIIADRYNVPELRRLAGSRIVAGLNGTWVVPFLFRTAYLFDELRQPVIKYVVKNKMTQVASKKTQEEYFDHPECSAIFGEIISELWADKNPTLA